MTSSQAAIAVLTNVAHIGLMTRFFREHFPGITPAAKLLAIFIFGESYLSSSDLQAE